MTARYSDEYVQLPQLVTDPATPAVGDARLFIKDDGTVNVRLDSGTIVDLTSGGNIALNEINDVSITTPTNGQILTYNAGTWENGAAPSGDIENAPDFSYGSNPSDPNAAIVTTGTQFASLPMTPTVFFRNNSNPVFVAGNATVALDFSMSNVIENSRASDWLDYAETLNTGTGVLRTNSNADVVMLMISGYFKIDYSTYASADAIFQMYLIDNVAGNNETATPTATSHLIWDGSVAQMNPTQGDAIIHFNVPIFSGEGGTAGRHFYLLVQNTTVDSFAVSGWTVMMNVFELFDANV